MLNFQITIARSDGKQVILELNEEAFDLLVSCADIGFEGADGNLAAIDDLDGFIDQLTEMRDEAEWSTVEGNNFLTPPKLETKNTAYAKYEETGDERLRTVL